MSLIQQIARETGLDEDSASKFFNSLERLAIAASADANKVMGSTLEGLGEGAQRIIPSVEVGKSSTSQEGFELPTPLALARLQGKYAADAGRGLKKIGEGAQAHLDSQEEPKTSDERTFGQAVEDIIKPEKSPFLDEFDATGLDDTNPQEDSPAQKKMRAEGVFRSSKAEPAKAEPAKAEPAKAEPAKAEPAKAEPAKAEPEAQPEPAEADPQKAIELFKTVHGGKFDPKSSMDKRKLAEISEMLADPENASLSPNQFALKLYRTKGYV